MMQDFYISLPSNTPGLKNKNTSSQFRIQLPEEIRLPYDEQWEVALVEIQYPYSWFNVTDDVIVDSISRQNFSCVTKQNEIAFVRFDGSTYCVKVPPAYYADIEALTYTIEELTKKAFEKEPQYKMFNFHVERTTNRVLFERNDNKNRTPGILKGVVMSPKLHYMMGFKNYYLMELSDDTLADHPPDMRAGIDSLFVYCDIVQPQIVGNKKEQLLRIVPIEGKYGDIIGRTFNSPHYIPVLNKQFSTIEISIKTDQNTPFPFEFGKSVVKLHFRKYRGFRL